MSRALRLITGDHTTADVDAIDSWWALALWMLLAQARLVLWLYLLGRIGEATLQHVLATIYDPTL